MPTYTSPFTGTVVQPTDVSYYALTFTTNTYLYWPAVVNPTQVPAARIMDCSTSVDNLQIYLPQGNQGTVGADILIRNTGSKAISIVNFAGGASVSVAPGVSRYFYLSDNSTSAGVWQNVTFGAGVSSADAASLQGAGLTTILGRLAVTSNIVEVAVIPTLVDTSRASSFVWTSGAATLPLPDSDILSSGWWIGFRNAGTGALVIEPPSPALINGRSNIIVNPNNSGFIYLDNTTGNFYTFGFSAEINPTFTAATYDVDSIPTDDLSLVAFAPTIQSYVALSGTRTTSLVVTLPPITQMYCLLNKTLAGGYDIEFRIADSVVSFVLPANHAAVVISSGPDLIVISDVALESFYALDGSASAPSFSFVSDANTGMYLTNTGVLSFSANTVEMLTLDNSDTMNPQVITQATFTALDGISGGTF